MNRLVNYLVSRLNGTRIDELEHATPDQIFTLRVLYDGTFGGHDLDLTTQGKYVVTVVDNRGVY